MSQPAPNLPASVRGVLVELEVRLSEASIEALVHNAYSVRSRFEEIRDSIPESAVAALHSAAFIEFKLYDFKRANKNLAAREEKRRLLASSEEKLQQSKEEVDKVNSLEATLKEQEDLLVRLKQEHEALKAALLAKEKEITEAESLISATSQALTTQKARAETALATAEQAVTIVPDEIGTDDDDLYTLASIDQIRISALDEIRRLLYPST